MATFREDPDYRDLRMVHAVMGLFERDPPIQRIVQFGGLLGLDVGNDLGLSSEEDIDNFWLDHKGRFHGLPEPIHRKSIRTPTRSSNSVIMPPPHRFTPSPTRELPKLGSVPVQPVQSHAERKARLLEEAKKSKVKADKKRLKKQRQKERKRLEKEKQNPQKSVMEKDDSQQSKTEESKTGSDKSKKSNSSSGVKHLTTPENQDTSSDIDSSDSSDEESSDEEGSGPESDSEELDLTSTFVSKAALIAKRKLEQKAKPERKERKKPPIKEETQPAKDKPNEDKPNEDHNDVKKNIATSSNPTFEDNIKISTELAVLGNKYASVGRFDMAVKYFTDAIKYNPTEYKLFGNRSFCFEKMHQYEKALTDAQLSLSMVPGWVKGLYRKGRALAGLKRYEEAALAFKEVLKLDSACTDAAQELMRVQITQLMEYGFSREQSSNALIIHGTIPKALEVLSKLHYGPGAISKQADGSLPPALVENINGTSPVPSANPKPHPPQAQNAPKLPLNNRPLGPVQNMSNVHNQPTSYPNHAVKTNYKDPQPSPELFPIWVGNLVYTVTESMVTALFRSVGAIYSVKLLNTKRCAFVNFTNQEDCDEAIRRFHGHELMGTRIIVRYPDRIPSGMGMSRSALRAEDLQDENSRQRECVQWRNGGCSRKPSCPYRHVLEHRGIDQC
ncbi:uncharacterized protein ACJ7VT_012735 [Polymixia lowei]